MIIIKHTTIIHIVLLIICTLFAGNEIQAQCVPLPSGTLTGEVICAGDSEAHLTFTASSGTGPFSLVINGVTYNNVTSGVPFNVTVPLVTTVYILTNITDINGCSNP